MEDGMTYYSAEVQMPKSKREGLENFIQIIINKLEAGDARNGLLSAVDLLHDLRSGTYDEAFQDSAAFSAHLDEMANKHLSEVIAAGQRGHADGVAAERERISNLLGL